jgi:hypothetical protein
MQTVIRLLAITAWLAAPAMTQAQNAEVPAPTTFKAGDTWEWRQVDTRTNLEDRKLTVTLVNVDGQLQVYDGATHHPIDRWFRDDGLTPSSKPWRVWPLEVGKRWAVDADRVRPDGITVNVRQDVEVVA